MRPLACATAPARDSKVWQRGTTTWEEILGWVEEPATVKACGNYLLGTLSADTRSNRTIVSRSGLTLDADTPRPDLPDVVGMILGCAAAVHTTFSSTPDSPRYRVIIPLDRDLLPDEYQAAASVMMDRLGADQFDKGSVEPARYMFRPAAQEPGWYQSWVFEGPPAVADDLLADFDPDLSQLATPRPHRNKRDPLGIEGTIGAFNRAYEGDFAGLIGTYELPYAPAEGERWSLVGSASVAGVGEMGEGLLFSHHITDPAYGQACSAFDLVRLHRFGDLDNDTELAKPVNRRASQEAMMGLATADARVLRESFPDLDLEDDDAWKLGLVRNQRTQATRDTIGNWDLIAAHDPTFKRLRFNEFTMTVEVTADLPWRRLAEGGQVLSASDRFEIRNQLEREHGFQPSSDRLNAVILTSATRSRYNPVTEYLGGLVWDGVERLDTCLPGVRPTPFTRMVARKCMVAAVARAYEPGVKWDHALILYGTEGIGKSHWIERVAKGFSAPLGRIGDKDTLLTLQRSWVLVADEGFSLKKADADAQKEFLTRTDDVFRAPYGVEPVAYKRHCVIWGTTNDEVFLRRQEGNRRFLIVRCEDKVDFTLITPEYVDQLWAEAVVRYRAGELLYLDDEESATARVERETFTEEDALAGVVQEYLDTPVPEEWPAMSPDARSGWLSSYAGGLLGAGPSRIDETCSAQIYVEALGKRFGDHKRVELLDITTVLKRLPDWIAEPGERRLKGYGQQKVFVRRTAVTAELESLI